MGKYNFVFDLSEELFKEDKKLQKILLFLPDFLHLVKIKKTKKIQQILKITDH